MTNVSKRYLEPRKKHKSVGDHSQFLERIKKTLYYGKLPVTDRLSLPVTEYVSEIFSEVQYGLSLERLHCDVAASISRNTCISPCSLVLAMMYLDRLKVYNPEYLKKVAPSELFLISLMVSSKFLHDDGEDSEVFTDEWAASGGVTVPELIKMEKEFLNAIQWEVFVSEKTFWSRLNDLERTIALRQGKDRGGWFTYTDLHHLLDDIEVYSLIQYLATVTTVTMVSYAASVLTIFGSVLLASQIPGTALHQSSQKNQSALTINNQITVQSESTLPGVSIETDELVSNLNEYTMTGFVTDTIEDNIEIPQISNKSVDPVKVLTTGFILASIHTRDSTNHTTDKTGWDWWTNDLMNWLYDYASKFDGNDDTEPIEADFKLRKFDYGKRLDMSIANSKILNCEDQLNKATSTRIQDQLESSWHMEWTDSILQKFKPYYSRFITPSILSTII